MSGTNKKFYSDVQIKSDIIIDNATANAVPIFDGAKKIKSSAVTSTELGYVSGASSNLQAQITAVQTQVNSLPAPMTYKGTWNATTNTPTLANTDVGRTGWVYYVTVAGSVNFGAGSISFDIGDKVVNNGTTWDKWDMTDSVTSVFGRNGAITAQSGDYTTDQVTEGTNQYFTVERAQDAIGSAIANTNTIALTYNDAGNAITADARVQMSITSDTSGLKLQGDSASPGNVQYYGTNSSGTKGFYAIPVQGSAGDIQETSFSFANNQSAAANVTGLAFSNAVVRSFQAHVSVFVDASVDLFEQFTLKGIQRGSDWAMSIESEGDDSGLAFTITSAGQIQYTSLNATGFTAGTIKFRALTTGV